MSLESQEYVGGLKARNQELLGEIRRLKDENLALKAGQEDRDRLANENVLMKGRLNVLGAGGDEKPIEKFIRENAGRLQRLESGSEAWKDMLAKIEAEMEPLLKAEGEKYGAEQQAKVARMTAAVEEISKRKTAERIASGLARPGMRDLLLPHVLERVAVKWDGDECVAFFTAADGGEVSEPGLVAEFRELRPEFANVVEGASTDDKIAHARRVAATLGLSATPARALTRAQFDAMDPQARATAMAGGATIVEH
jgi:hypothetical protein